MKKILAIFLCLLMMLTFVACDSGKDNNKKSEGGDSGSAVTTKASESASVKYYVNVGSVKVELGGDADAVITALGTPKATAEVGNCGGQGTLTKYSYASVEIYVLTSGTSKTIDQITLLDDTVSTAEGIKIGSAQADVKTKCKTPTKSSESSYTYTSGNKNLKFNFRDGAVVGIDYMRTTG